MVLITSSTVVFGACAAVRERTQRIKITQLGGIAVYRFTDDFGQEPMLAAVLSADTYIFTAQYDTAPTFPGTSTVIVRAEFVDDDTGTGVLIGHTKATMERGVREGIAWLIAERQRL